MQRFWNSLLVSPALFCGMLVVGSAAFASEAPTPEAENVPYFNTMAQVTSVSQLSDVQPTDWAFQALQSLVERYGCIAGYPNGTFRGNRAMTRYEFAAGLNACLNRVGELISTATDGFANKQDIARIQKLEEQFAPELATLRGRVDAVEAKTAELEANRFSTTTKLQGQVVGVVSDVLSGKRVNEEEITDNNTTLGVRARIELVSSFTGQDTLFTRIQANNIVTPNIGTNEGNLFFASGNSGAEANTSASLDALWYGFPLGKDTQVKILANADAADDLASTISIFDGDGAFGALSTFGTRNPIYGETNGAGLGITHEFGDKLALGLGYLTASPNDPSQGSGLFNGSYGALAQLTFKPSDRISIGLTYINSYKQGLLTGSNRATFNVGQTVQDGESGGEITQTLSDIASSSNSYGIEASLGLSEKFVLGGWVGYTNTRNLATTAGFPNRGEVDIWNYAVTLGFPDLGKKGNLAGIILGMEPKVTSSSIQGLDKDRDTSYHVEAFYQYKVSDNITITPGVIWLTAPDHNNNNDDVVIGALRTTFSF
jgi:hypothetical protein